MGASKEAQNILVLAKKAKCSFCGGANWNIIPYNTTNLSIDSQKYTFPFTLVICKGCRNTLFIGVVNP